MEALSALLFSIPALSVFSAHLISRSRSSRSQSLISRRSHQSSHDTSCSAQNQATQTENMDATSEVYQHDTVKVGNSLSAYQRKQSLLKIPVTGEYTEETTPNDLSHDKISQNGLSQNGLSHNGLSQNGLSQNGLSQNGHSRNGLSQNNKQLKRGLSKEEILDLRQTHYGPSCCLFFKSDPLQIESAQGQYMYDETGNRLIDCINNVAHVGHCHPRVTQAAVDQMSKLYTNNRYLHNNLVTLAQRITQTLPGDLSVCYFTNSGSEANDLALQMARLYAQQRDVITLDNAYHGTVTSLQEINPYKWKQTDSQTSSLYKVSWSHVVPAPDAYRGKYPDSQYSDDELLDLYVDEVQDVVSRLEEEGKAPAAFIAESMQSCGGQIVYPHKYLERVQRVINGAGGLVIADEVQVGFGRVGDHWWAFQQYDSDFVPDIVTLGKPMGNGHPVAAVVTTRHVAERFKLPYFNTYGGNPVSCAVALAVLDVIEEDRLKENAKTVGNHIMKRLRRMAEKHTYIGDVRGHGLFLGMDLVLDRETREPATQIAQRVVSELRHQGVLLSSDGPHDNVIKFKPPMCITTRDADEVCDKISAVLSQIRLEENEKYTCNGETVKERSI